MARSSQMSLLPVSYGGIRDPAFSVVSCPRLNLGSTVGSKYG